jgi:hypothetical protein
MKCLNLSVHAFLFLHWRLCLCFQDNYYFQDNKIVKKFITLKDKKHDMNVEKHETNFDSLGNHLCS